MENQGQKIHDCSTKKAKDITYSEVVEQHDKIIILASSQEARKFKPIDGYVVIAVNDAIHIAKEHADYWFTLDPSESNLKIMRDKPYNAKYYAALPWYINTPVARLERLKNCYIPDHVHCLFRCEGERKDKYLIHRLQEYRSFISTGNSAFGALNLAYHMNPKEIVILGVNGNRSSPKFDNKHCTGSLDHLPKLFQSALNQLDTRGIKVYNANKDTKVKCFPYSSIFD
jgi:hypothetical protein